MQEYIHAWQQVVLGRQASGNAVRSSIRYDGSPSCGEKAVPLVEGRAPVGVEEKLNMNIHGLYTI